MNTVRVGVLYCTYRTVWAQGGRTEVSVEWGDVLRGCDEWDCVLHAGGWWGGEGGEVIGWRWWGGEFWNGRFGGSGRWEGGGGYLRLLGGGRGGTFGSCVV